MRKLLPEEIEKKSFEMITKELGDIILDKESPCQPSFFVF